ncbi:hypothetical protein [Caulobacter segnis]|uniref:Uncharacterized protein n=1 Tax=Caulobacter segnis (strain ATCC 21756 / DSM 7131 / JCM 7823 / NBRC 15250 / LMG 17158 / TK0059) TaxID=509190 RepID=D5VN15_CAUST|nr:hypothetical protein [Caulobacter segnis]ADG11888.1 hypothetical protein Cseg_3458 [Caulobacter segnis ATCC 21756]
MTQPTEDETEDALAKASADRKDQGDIAADDAGATAIAHRVQEAMEDDDEVHCTD